MKRVPTDYQILDAIYERYYSAFAAYQPDQADRDSKVMVPIDIESLAKDLRVDADIVFGRLYYDLERRYGYKHDDHGRVSFFALSAGTDRHCVNFPYMASVLAEVRERRRQYRTATSIAIVSLVVSIGAIAISLLA